MLSQITTIDALVPLEVSAQADRLARAKQRQAAAAAAAAQASSSASKIALVSVAGGLTPRGNWSGSSLTGIAAQVTRAVDDHDVPASSSTSTVQAERSRQRGRSCGRRGVGKETCIAVANTLAVSAAYWIASQAGELVITPSADVGSIGAIIMHQDISGWLDRVGIKMAIVRSENRRIKTRRIHCRTRLEPICKAGQTRLAPISSRRSRAAVASRRPRSARNSVRAAWSARARPLRAAWRTGSQPSIRSSAACCSDARRGRARAVDRRWRSIDRLILEQQFYSPALFRD
ncbi:Peptidase family S49 [Bradyrhizobium brasilense]|uniref:Peptidase family S49 n=1 Tax=Bradyrhizobium brasilense TaxID=1419277 RepID=A0A1G7PD99_9BRAD|nr:Peptidase family S49 [Bradyrhizobium brasilense]